MHLLDYFAVENFRAFNKRQEFNLKPISILTGTNSSGKSSLSKALLLLKTMKARMVYDSQQNKILNVKYPWSDYDLDNFFDLKIGDYKNWINHDSESENMVFELPTAVPNTLGRSVLRLNYKPKKGPLTTGGELESLEIRNKFIDKLYFEYLASSHAYKVNFDEFYFNLTWGIDEEQAPLNELAYERYPQDYCVHLLYRIWKDRGKNHLMNDAQSYVDYFSSYGIDNNMAVGILEQIHDVKKYMDLKNQIYFHLIGSEIRLNSLDNLFNYSLFQDFIDKDIHFLKTSLDFIREEDPENEELIDYYKKENKSSRDAFNQDTFSTNLLLFDQNELREDENIKQFLAILDGMHPPEWRNNSDYSSYKTSFNSDSYDIYIHIKYYLRNMELSFLSNIAFENSQKDLKKYIDAFKFRYLKFKESPMFHNANIKNVRFESWIEMIERTRNEYKESVNAIKKDIAKYADSRSKDCLLNLFEASPAPILGQENLASKGLSLFDRLLTFVESSLGYALSVPSNILDAIDYVPSIRNLVDRNYSFSDSGNYFSLLLKKLALVPIVDTALAFLNKFLRVFEISDGVELMPGIDGGNLTIYFIKNGQRTNLADLGYGISQLLPILFRIALSINYTSAGIKNGELLIIEEPETNLHPSLQSKLADMFVYCSNNYKIQFILETHSEYLIRRMQGIVASGEFLHDQVNCYYFYHPEKIPEGEQQIYEMQFLEDGSLSKYFGKGFFDESSVLNIALYNQTKSNQN
jgi:AAA15 family ATPase/GTPase